MEDLNWIAVVARWLHVGSAIVLVGGTAFIRLVLMPAAVKLPQVEHDTLRGLIRPKWQMIVHVGILLFLLSGFYNYIAVAIPQHKGDKLYHMLVGTKILLAIVVFFIAVALTGRSKATEFLRKDAARWMAVNLALAAAIVAISGFLKVRDTPRQNETPAVASARP